MAVPPNPDTPSGLGSVLSFMRLIWAVDHGLQRSSKRMAAMLGLTGPQRLAIRILGRTEGITPGALAEILHLHPSTLTGILRRLEDRGVIIRAPDPRDSRRSLLFLTPDGRKLDVLVKGTIEDAVRKVLARSSPERIEEASQLLAAVARSLSRMAVDQKPVTPRPRVKRRRSSSRGAGRAN
jgi:DNA-binding MarR family transcriptional regulator